MTHNTDNGSLVTVSNDSRVTKVGRFIRKYRLDEISQLIDVFIGDMTFVGTRPEVEKYVKCYTPSMMATLLLPAGITSLASIYFKDEADMLNNSEEADNIYIYKILPIKMHYNLKEIEHFSLFGEIRILFMTLFAMCGKKYVGDHIFSKNSGIDKDEIHDK